MNDQSSRKEEYLFFPSLFFFFSLKVFLFFLLILAHDYSELQPDQVLQFRRDFSREKEEKGEKEKERTQGVDPCQS